jgi:hypothetical protein
MSKKFSFLILLVFVFFGCGKSTENTKTPPIEKEQAKKKFFNQDGQFRISFESDPTAYSQYIPYENGKILMNYFIYEKGINLIYCISYADYPEGFMKGKVATDFLGDLLVTFIDSKKAGLENQKQISVNTNPGIYFKASNSDEFIYGEYILKQNRLYQLTVTKEGSYHNETETNAFFNSLELL